MKSRFSWELVLIGAGIIFFAFYLILRDSDNADSAKPPTTQTEQSAGQEPSSNFDASPEEHADSDEIIAIENEIIDADADFTNETDPESLSDQQTSRSGGFDFGSIGDMFYSQGNFEDRYVKNGTLLSEESFSALGISEIATDAQMSNIRITPHSSSNVVVRMYLPANTTKDDFDKLYLANVTKSPEKVDISMAFIEKKGSGFFSWLFNLGSYRIDPFAPGIEILVPEGALSHNILTLAGNVEAYHIGGEIKLESRAGNISAEGLFGSMKLETRAGNIRVDSLIGDATLQTRAGNIHIKPSDAHIKAQTSAGNINYSRGNSFRSAELETRIGNIDISLPSDATVDVDLRATVVEFPRELSFSGDKDGRSIKGKVAGGGPQIKASSRLGNVNLHIQ
jgi:hypothetical protein